jgi:hypothetical protein
VRQASLAPQLRNTIPDEPAEPQQLRSPEQVRTIMSALQRGTTRGRLAAAGINPDAASAPQPANGSAAADEPGGSPPPDAGGGSAAADAPGRYRSSSPDGGADAGAPSGASTAATGGPADAAASSLGDAATVSLPIVRDKPQQDTVTRPDKDA